MSRRPASEGVPDLTGRELARLARRLGEGLALLRQRRVVWASARLAELTGRSPRALLGVGLEELVGGGAAAGPRRPEAGTAALHAQRAGKLGNGAELWVFERKETADRAEPRAGGSLEEARREIERLRRIVAREAAEREDLLTVVSHELRTPVTVIEGYGRLLLSEKVGALNAEQRRFLEESARSCRRLSDFIGNLLEDAARRGQPIALDLREADPGPAIEGVVTFLKPLLDEKRLRVEITVAPGTPRARFDPVRIDQVLGNLLANAIRYSPRDGVIEIQAGRARKPGWVELAVRDFGPGIPEPDRERIFEPYVQVSEGRRSGGLGLGLAICRRLVEAHGGTIGVVAAAGGGSRFAFTLPAAAVGGGRQ
jgi:signal transduction histidine kinase